MTIEPFFSEKPFSGASHETPQSDNPHVEVKQSHIHGLGLFAARKFRKGELIGHYEGPEVTEHQDGDHVLWVFDEDEGREYGVDGKNETRFVNHSRRANAHFNGLELMATQAIRPGEEITHDYGEAWSDLG